MEGLRVKVEMDNGELRLAFFDKDVIIRIRQREDIEDFRPVYSFWLLNLDEKEYINGFEYTVEDAVRLLNDTADASEE